MHVEITVIKYMTQSGPTCQSMVPLSTCASECSKAFSKLRLCMTRQSKQDSKEW